MKKEVLGWMAVMLFLLALFLAVVPYGEALHGALCTCRGGVK